MTTRIHHRLVIHLLSSLCLTILFNSTTNARLSSSSSSSSKEYGTSSSSSSSPFWYQNHAKQQHDKSDDDTAQHYYPIILPTMEGKVKGKTVTVGGKSIHKFPSIPYAKPPLGDLRFRNPEPVEPWDGVIDVTKDAISCIQHDISLLGSEDCLYLQVTTPADALEKGPLPVLFWIYGGGFEMGDSQSKGLTDATSIVSHYNTNVIVVQVNYRVSIFGFLAHTQLPSSGNMGLIDQRFALEWTQRNINFFGGDPQRVTIFGQSAGAMSVCCHLANNNVEKQLFHAAIMESGSCDAREFFLEWEEAVKYGTIYVEEVGCGGGDGEDEDNVGECLRRKTTREITTGLERAYRRTDVTLPVFAPLFGFGPVIDGTTTGLPEMPLTSIQQGRHNKVPLIIGANRDEGTIFLPFIPLIVNNTHKPLQPSDVPLILHHIFDRTMSHDAVTQLINDVRRLYPINDGDDDVNLPTTTTNDQVNAMIRDYIFLCPSRRTARAASSSSDVFMYYFTYTNGWLDSQIFGTYHAFDLSFLWSGPDARPPRRPRRTNGKDRKMEEIFKWFWTTMAMRGTPNSRDGEREREEGLNLIEWPRFETRSNEMMMNLTVPLGVISGQTKTMEVCDFWDNIMTTFVERDVIS